LPYKKIIIEPAKPSAQSSASEEKTLDAIVEPAKIVKVSSPDPETPPIIVVKAAAATTAATKKPDPPSGWKKMLLDGDPISVTDITKVFQEGVNVYSGPVNYQYTYTVAGAFPGQSFQVSMLSAWNNGSSNETIAFRFGTGPLRFMQKLSPNTGFMINLVKTIWRGPTNTPFNIYTFEPSPTVTYTVIGENQP
jgi:hypothetical protein